MFIWFLFVISCVLVYMRLVRPHLHWRERQVPHNTAWPICGNFGRSTLRLTSIAENLRDIYEKFKNHRYFGFYSYMQPLLVLKDIDLIKRITVKDFDNFTDHFSFIDVEANPLFGKNLFSLKGQKWRDMRATLSPAFTSSKMRNMYVLITECAEQFVSHFSSKATNNSTVTVEMKDVLTRFANDVIATSAFGIKCDSLGQPDNEFYAMGKEATNFTGFRVLKLFGYNISPMLMRLFRVQIFSNRVCDFFRSLVHTTIETREREGIVRPDMIHLLMEAKKGKLRHEVNGSSTKDADAGFATVHESDTHVTSPTRNMELSDDEITAQAILFFFAGFDTISSAMCHMSHELAIHENIQKRLQQEIDATYEETGSGGHITYDQVLKMQYLDMVLSETLRKWPAAIFADRVCINSGYELPPATDSSAPVRLKSGDVLWLPIFALHRDPDYFPDPERFDPERFNEENKHNIKPFSYIPFGAGPRNCIGSRFALLEAKIFFVHLLRKFNIVVVEKTQIPLKLNTSSFNLNSEKGFWLGFQPRTEI